MEHTWVYNHGDKDIEFTHDGTRYLLLAHTKEQYPARVVWLLLGDPDLRPGMRNKPTFGTNMTWSREVERLMHKHAAWWFNPDCSNGQYSPPGKTEFDKNSVWKYIIDGNLYSPDFCRRKECSTYYSTADKIQRPMHVSNTPLTDADDREAASNRVSKASVKTSHQAITDDDEDDAPVGRREKAVA